MHSLASMGTFIFPGVEGAGDQESCLPTFLPSETSQLAYRKESKFFGVGYE